MRSPIVLFLLALSLPFTAVADEACLPEEVPQTTERALRALSLDLRGVVPEVSELESVVNETEVPAEMLDEWLSSDAFAQRVVRHHRDLLWNNVSNLYLMDYRAFMQTTESGTYWRRYQAFLYRGLDVPCTDEPAEFGPDGTPIATLQPDGTMREGMVWVEPYWYPGTEIAVCAFDAQEAFVSPSGAQCDTSDGYGDPRCGCGPELRWCTGYNNPDPVMVAMAEDVDRRIAEVITEDESYLELFTGHEAWVNGPLAYFLTNQTGFPSNIRMTPMPVATERLPDLDYTQASTWVKVDLDDEHAGILTSPAYLLRFQTLRARANRFYNAFLCQPFQPPPGGLPAPNDSVPVLDLQQRDGCKYCHGLLEPASAYWGRWTPSGGGYLDPVSFPPMREECRSCAVRGQWCGQECSQFYVTNAITAEEEPYLGWLKAYEFRRPEHESHVEEGPARLALEAVVDGRLQTCVARNTVRWLLGRETTPDDDAWIAQLATELEGSGWSYRALVEKIVTSPIYRSAR